MMRATLVVGGALAVAAAGCAHARPPLGVAVERPVATAAREIDIAVTHKGFEPADVAARVGETVRLVFTRTVEHTCVTSVTLWLTAGQTIERALRVDVPVSLTLELVAPGDIGFACPMHMYGGRIVVK